MDGPLPKIGFRGDSCGLYTFLIVDLDIFRADNPNITSFIHYMNINVKGNDLSTGEEANSLQ